MFATLYPHHGQPLPQWPFKVSTNSLLSVYALVLKAVIAFILASCIGQLQWTWFAETRPLTDMLHFDSATRGADGALGLIWRQRFRQPLTSLGCMILVLSLAVDPFTQQLVRPVDCSVEQREAGAIATLSRVNVLVSQIRVQNLSTITKEVDDVMREAMYSTGEDPRWQCSTFELATVHSLKLMGVLGIAIPARTIPQM
ncbi:hypothetical protein DHEL01_v208520 [Diaporthe helianthi]|uniref:Uncharacterized protein n=1 Tax=Diaporthe helianthi TaxID=158607 RepID=A0A2P5HS67_DIAHE|nr:hypothetical protein DHEL01_v208520 [Diaporthe helianthi]